METFGRLVENESGKLSTRTCDWLQDEQGGERITRALRRWVEGMERALATRESSGRAGFDVSQTVP